MHDRSPISWLMALALLAGAAQSQSLDILVALPPGVGGIDVVPRLQGLGHTVTTQDASTWGPTFDYTLYDVVVFEHDSTEPADIAHLVNTVDAGEIGVVFFRGHGTIATATALGMITGLQLWWQTPTDLDVVDNSHPITCGLPLGVMNLGYMYMSLVEAPDPVSTTTLASGPAGAALLVHNSRLVVVTPYYGHTAAAASETMAAIALTEASLQWAAGNLAGGPCGRGCTLTTPSSPATGAVAFTIDTTTPSSPTVDLNFEFSLDSGATYLPATAAAGSPLLGMATGVPIGMAEFHWDTVADGVATVTLQPGVLLRATMDDGTAVTSCATMPFDVDNAPLCALCGDCDLNLTAATILDALSAAQIAAGLLTPTVPQSSCCDVDSSLTITVLDALGIAQAAAGLPVTLTCP